MQPIVEKYFVEFEFKTPKGSTYWFPLFLMVETLEGAVQYSKNIEIALNSRWEVLRRTEPVPLVDNLNAKFREDYVRNGLSWSRSKLRLHLFELHDIEQDNEKTFEEHMEIVDASPDDYLNKTLATSTHYTFPISVLEGAHNAKSEFLVFDVIKP